MFIYKGIVYLVDNPNELFHSLYWSLFIRTTSSEYAHFITNSEDNSKAIFPSDFIYFYYRKDHTQRNIKDINNYNNKDKHDDNNDGNNDGNNDDENNIRILYYYRLILNYPKFRIYIGRIKEVGKNYISKFHKY